MMLIGGILCRYMISGWLFIFILAGGFGIIWLVLWIWYVSDSPETHTTIGHDERDYICKSIGTNAGINVKHATGFFSLPWKNIIRSKPIMALFFTHSCNVFGLFFFYSNIGKLLIEIHHVSTVNTGYILASGFVMMAMCSLCSGKYKCSFIFTHFII